MGFDGLLPFCVVLEAASFSPAGDDDRCCCCFRLLLSGCRGDSADDGFIMVSEDQLIINNIHPLYQYPCTWGTIDFLDIKNREDVG